MANPFTLGGLMAKARIPKPPALKNTLTLKKLPLSKVRVVGGGY